MGPLAHPTTIFSVLLRGRGCAGTRAYVTSRTMYARAHDRTRPLQWLKVARLLVRAARTVRPQHATDRPTSSSGHHRCSPPSLRLSRSRANSFVSRRDDGAESLEGDRRCRPDGHADPYGGLRCSCMLDGHVQSPNDDGTGRATPHESATLALNGPRSGPERGPCVCFASRPMFGPTRVTIAQLWPIPVDARRALAHTGRCWPSMWAKFPHILDNSGQTRPLPPGIGEHWADFALCCPNSTKLGPASTNFNPNSASLFGRCSTKVGPNSAQCDRRWPRIRQERPETRPNLAQVGPETTKLGQFGPSWQAVRQCSWIVD